MRIIKSELLPANASLVVYSRYLDQIFFTGLSPFGRAMSTVNQAEEIIIALCQQERLDLHGTMFFDLRTHLQYDYLRPGEYEAYYVFCQRRNLHVSLHWQLMSANTDRFKTRDLWQLPKAVLHEFRTYIFAPRWGEEVTLNLVDWIAGLTPDEVEKEINTLVQSANLQLQPSDKETTAIQLRLALRHFFENPSRYSHLPTVSAALAPIPL
ncbi:hypothetical protein M1116_02505 [Patescibacteria group bacterium]|nr:hypothetical protein [Patescibacteria group bacterium]